MRLRAAGIGVRTTPGRPPDLRQRRRRSATRCAIPTSAPDTRSSTWSATWRCSASTCTGSVVAHRSGHQTNHALVRRLLEYGRAARSGRRRARPAGGGRDARHRRRSCGLLPHRYPFLLVDRVLELDAGPTGCGRQERQRQRAVLRRALARPADHAGRAHRRGDRPGRWHPDRRQHRRPRRDASRSSPRSTGSSFADRSCPAISSASKSWANGSSPTPPASQGWPRSATRLGGRGQAPVRDRRRRDRPVAGLDGPRPRASARQSPVADIKPPRTIGSVVLDSRPEGSTTWPP